MLTRSQLVLLLAAVLLSLATAKPSKPHRMTIFAAGYNGTIVPFSLSPRDGSLAPLSRGVAVNSSGTSPSWIAFSRPSALYAVSDLYSVDEASPGRLFSHTYDAATGTISHTGSKTGVSSGGDGPVSVLIGHGPSKGLVFVANYGSGSAAVLKLNQDGTLQQPEQVIQFTRPAGQPAVGPVADRQDHSYAHQVSISPSGNWLYVCDLGADQIHHLHIQGGKVEFTGSTNVKLGSGPRHITFHRDPQGDVYAYLASELDNTVSAFRVNKESGELNLIGKPLLASPPGVPLSGAGVLPTNRTTAEIAVVPAGDYVYVSNRGDTVQDHISVFKRHKTGELTFVEWVGSGGRMPRHFSLSSDTGKDDQARWLVVGHQTDQNLVVFRRDVSSGGLEKVSVREDVGQVAFAGFSPF